MSKKKVAVLFGGQSSEHEVSCISAVTVISNIDNENYEIIIIGITKEGKWIEVNNIEDIQSGNWRNSNKSAILSPDGTHKGIIIITGNTFENKSIDVIFPILHGKNGEDGTIQGLIELTGIPYVGCGVLASSIAMDKLYTKLIIERLGIPQAKYVAIRKYELNDIKKQVTKIETELSYPIFVKPSNAGSSRGISKAYSREELIKALEVASEHDNIILAEETIEGREIECAVLGGNNPKASRVGEIVAAADFYDYDAKYNSQDSKTIIAPDLPEGVEDIIKEYSIAIFKEIDGYGLSRVDFFLENNTGKIIFNEINTIPGFTSISMYPMLWESMGLGKQQLIEKLIQLAFVRNKE